MMALVAAAAIASTGADRFVDCDFGRVTGSDAQNKAIIEGSFRLSALVRGDKSTVELRDATPLLARTAEPHVRAMDSRDGKLNLIAEQEGSWTPVLGIDPETAGHSDRVATLMRLDRSSGAFDHDWFYYGHCSVTAGPDAAARYRAAK